MSYSDKDGKAASEEDVVLRYDSEKPPTLEEAQKFVGGLVEMVYTRDGRQMLVNEEGLIHRLPFNPLASVAAGRPIVGNALVLSGKARWK